MSNFTTLCLGDFHIKDFQHKNQYLDKFEYEVSLESFKVIYKIIEDNNISKLLILGDFTDVAPQAEAIELAHTFLKGLPQGLEIILIDGNHELIEGKAKKQYYWYGIKQKMLDNYNVKVYDYVEVGNTLFVNGKKIVNVKNASVIDVSGKIIYQESTPFKDKNAIDVQKLIPGVYILKVDDKAVKFFKK